MALEEAAIAVLATDYSPVNWNSGFLFRYSAQSIRADDVSGFHVNGQGLGFAAFAFHLENVISYKMSR